MTTVPCGATACSSLVENLLPHEPHENLIAIDLSPPSIDAIIGIPRPMISCIIAGSRERETKSIWAERGAGDVNPSTESDRHTESDPADPARLVL
jgi:hypothetical protein